MKQREERIKPPHVVSFVQEDFEVFTKSYGVGKAAHHQQLECYQIFKRIANSFSLDKEKDEPGHFS